MCGPPTVPTLFLLVLERFSLLSATVGALGGPDSWGFLILLLLGKVTPDTQGA